MNLKKISNLISNLAAKNWNEKCKKKKKNLKKLLKKEKKICLNLLNLRNFLIRLVYLTDYIGLL